MMNDLKCIFIIKFINYINKKKYYKNQNMMVNRKKQMHRRIKYSIQKNKPKRNLKILNKW